MGVPDTGDTTWMLASSALVLLMTPGLAFFYGGMVRPRGVLNMLTMSFSAVRTASIVLVVKLIAETAFDFASVRPSSALSMAGADREAGE
jgi:ammonia channel protein AmtB